MKRLRKLLGILLTGVMALTLLAGCAGTASLNEKEILATVKDYYKVSGYGDIETDTTNYAKKAAAAIKTYYSDPENDQTKTVEDLVSGADIDYGQTDLAGIRTAVVPEGSTDRFYLCYVIANSYASSYLQKHQNAMIARDLIYGDPYSADLNADAASGSESKAFFSLCTETIDGETYVFLVARGTAS